MTLFVLFAIVIMFVLLYKDVLKPSILFFGCLSLFLVFDLINLKTFLGNFVNPSLLSLLLLLIIAAIISKSDLLAYLYEHTLPKKRNIFKLSALAASVSAFVVNALVASIAIKTIHNRENSHRLLLPIAYMAILGGTCTLVGSSTNLILNSFVVSYDLPSIDLFAFASIGVPVTIAGLIYLTFFSGILLKNSEVKPKENLDEYFLEVKVLPGSSLIGNSVGQNKLRNLDNIYLAEILRNENLISPVSPREIIYENDILIFTGEIQNIKDLSKFDGLEIFDQDNEILKQNLIWGVVSNTSNIAGKTIKEVNFRSLFDAAVVAVKRGSEKLSGKIGSIKLKPGDYLILATGDDFSKNESVRHNFFVTSQLEIVEKLSITKSIILLLLFITGIFLSAIGLITLFKMLIVLLFLCLVLKLTSFSEIRKAFNLDLLILVGSALGIAKVLIDSGVAELVSSLIINVSSNFGVYGTLVGIYLLAVLFTEIIHNNAAAALVFPVAYASAVTLDVNVMPFIMAVAFGAAASFITPYGYHVNLMVYSTGNYKPVDFLRLGLPLSIIYSILVLLLIPVFFKF